MAVGTDKGLMMMHESGSKIREFVTLYCTVVAVRYPRDPIHSYHIAHSQTKHAQDERKMKKERESEGEAERAMLMREPRRQANPLIAPL